jgi:glycerophosphoryl diester phosphodiesterase
MTSTTTLVAHRYGNTPATAARAVGRADVIELDVHVFRGRVEVRHEKVLRPTSRLFERWYLLPPGTEVPTIDEVLAAVGPDVTLMLDLKCSTRRAARLIRRAVPGNQSLIVSSRNWWVLGAFADRPRTTLLRSCANWRELWLVLALGGLGDRLGAVVHERALDRQTVERLAARTPHVYTWAVESPERAKELVDAGVSGLIVDDLDRDWPIGRSSG